MANISSAIANVLKEAARIREESFDQVAAARNTDSSAGFSQYYRKSLLQAAEEACAAVGEPQLAYLVNCMLYNIWNDSLQWAEDVAQQNS